MHGIVLTPKPKQMEPQRQAEAKDRTHATVTAAVKSVVRCDGDDPNPWEARFIVG